MSPKSTIPVTCPASSARALSVVRSVWTTWARRDGQTGTTVASNRSRTRFDERPMPRVADRAEQLPGPAGVLDVPEHRPLGARVEETAQRPTETCRHRAPAGERLVGQGDARRSGRGRAGRRTSGRGARRRRASTRRAGRRGSVASRVAPGTSHGMASGSDGSTRWAWRTASASMSSVAGSSAAFESFRTASGASAPSSSRNVWSRSLPRSRASPRRRRTSAERRRRRGSRRMPGALRRGRGPWSAPS